MGNKKNNALKIHGDIQKGEFITSEPPKPSELLEDVKREVQRRTSLPVKDAKADLRNAISEAARHDVQTSRSRTVKEAKRGRRDVIVKTIMRHTRQSH